MSQAKFKHPRGVRLTLDSGHVTHVGKEWEPLDERFHQAALEKGCHCDQEIIGDRVDPNASTRTVTDTTEKQRTLDEPALIRIALMEMIGRNQEGDFTTDNLPNTNVVKKLAGFACSKQSVMEAWNKLNAEADPGASI